MPCRGCFVHSHDTRRTCALFFLHARTNEPPACLGSGRATNGDTAFFAPSLVPTLSYGQHPHSLCHRHKHALMMLCLYRLAAYTRRSIHRPPPRPPAHRRHPATTTSTPAPPPPPSACSSRFRLPIRYVACDKPSGAERTFICDNRTMRYFN